MLMSGRLCGFFSRKDAREQGRKGLFGFGEPSVILAYFHQHLSPKKVLFGAIYLNLFMS